MVRVGAAPLNAFLPGIDSIALVVGNGEIVSGQLGNCSGFRSVVAAPCTEHFVVACRLHHQHMLGLFMHLVHIVREKPVYNAQTEKDEHDHSDERDNGERHRKQPGKRPFFTHDASPPAYSRDHERF